MMVHERKSYFISMDKQRIDETSIGDTTEYEVIVNSDELETFKSYIAANNTRDFWFAMQNITFKPFNEVEVDDMRVEDDDNLMKAYQFIYAHGTEETKRKLGEIGFTDKHYHRK